MVTIKIIRWNVVVSIMMMVEGRRCEIMGGLRRVVRRLRGQVMLRGCRGMDRGIIRLLIVVWMVRRGLRGLVSVMDSQNRN